VPRAQNFRLNNLVEAAAEAPAGLVQKLLYGIHTNATRHLEIPPISFIQDVEEPQIGVIPFGCGIARYKSERS
jgi:hypothetical protein